jgi:hypothetical protein
MFNTIVDRKKCVLRDRIRRLEEELGASTPDAGPLFRKMPQDIQASAAELSSDVVPTQQVVELESTASAAVVIDDAMIHAEKRYVKEAIKEKKGELQKRGVGVVWSRFCAVHADQHGRAETSLMMDRQSEEEQREQLLEFSSHCIEEIEMSGKMLESTFKALALYFSVFRPERSWLFLDKQVVDVIKRERSMTFEQQKDAARRAYATQTQALSIRQVLRIAEPLFAQQDEREAKGLGVMAVCLAVACISNWGWRPGTACGPLEKDLRDHGVHPNDVSVLFSATSSGSDDDTDVVMYKSHEASDMKAALAAGYTAIDVVICLPSNKSIRKKAVRIPPARSYSVGYGKKEQAQVLGMLIRYVLAAGLQNTPDSRFFRPCMKGDEAVAMAVPARKKVNGLFREAARVAGLHGGVVVSSKSGRVATASLLGDEVDKSQEWSIRSTVPKKFYVRTSTVGGAGQSEAETDRIEGDVRVISRNLAVAEKRQMRSGK